MKKVTIIIVILMFISSASYAQKVIKKIDRTVDDIEEASDVISEFGKDAKYSPGNKF